MAGEYQTQLIAPGLMGIDLRKALDEIPLDKLARMTNVIREEDGSLRSRYGRTPLLTCFGNTDNHHSHLRMELPGTSDYNRLVGAGSDLFFGKTGALDLIDSGYSGKPLSIVNYRPPLSGDTWAYIADSQRMRKVRAVDGLDLPIGLPKAGIGNARYRLDEFRMLTGTPSGGGVVVTPGSVTVKPAALSVAYPGTNWIAYGGGVLTITQRMADGSDATGAYPDLAIDALEKIGFVFGATTIPVGATVTGVELSVRTYADNYLLYIGANVGGVISMAAVQYENSDSQPVADGTQRYRTQRVAITAPGGGAWTAADLDVAQFYFYFNFGGSYTPILIDISRTDSYTTTTAGAGSGGLSTAADRTRFTSVGFDIAANAPSGLYAYAPVRTKTIDDCEAAGWTNNAGTGGAPSNSLDGTDKKVGSGSVLFTSAKGAAVGAYYNFWSKANVLDLSAFSDGREITDNDIIHVWLKCSDPKALSEIRIYFVCSTAFDTATVPGTDATKNTDAYMKAIRSDDFTSVYELTTSTTTAAGTTNTTTQTYAQLQTVADTRQGQVELIRQQREQRRQRTITFAPGKDQWTEFGCIGVPLYRGDFRRIGNNATRAWGNIVGVVMVLVTADNTSPVTMHMDDLYLTGGSGPDTSQVGYLPYDYRVINFDPRCGAKSNPSDPLEATLDARRQGIMLTPQAYGDAEIRQRFFRRGGSLLNDWYYIGQNESDGGMFLDELSDLEIIAAGTIEDDNDQPVTTIDSAGEAVYTQPVKAFIGPIQDLIIAVGDPRQPGYAYWCKPGQPDHWPLYNSLEVCAPSDELIGGGILDGQAYLLSRKTVFRALVNLASAGVVTTVGTAATHGAVAKRGICVGAGKLWYVSDDGIYAFDGSVEKNITDEVLYPIFHGLNTNGYLPIDWAYPDNIRLIYYNNYLFFSYRDTNGNQTSVLAYSTIFDHWLVLQFGGGTQNQIEDLSVETVPGAASNLLIGDKRVGLNTVRTSTYSGAGDNGNAVSCNIRTGALDQGFKREEKLYGDVVVDVAEAETSGFTLTPYINAEVSVLPAVVFGTGVLAVNRTRFTLDPFGTGVDDTQKARNVSLDISWVSLTYRPRLYILGVSYIPQPDDSIGRPTDWSNLGRGSDKYVKGVMMECDTGGVDKLVVLDADGAAQNTITVNADGRQVLQFSFPQFRGRVLRLRPNGDTTNWKLYAYSWIFDEEPLRLSRWETQLVTHGISAHQVPLYSYISLDSSADVTLTLTTLLENGNSIVKNYVIPSTDGNKLQRYVPFQATKGVMFKYLFTSSAPFWLYREESSVAIQPWPGGQIAQVYPFGTDDIDGVRGLRDAQDDAKQSGGGSRKF